MLKILKAATVFVALSVVVVPLFVVLAIVIGVAACFELALGK